MSYLRWSSTIYKCILDHQLDWVDTSATPLGPPPDRTLVYYFIEMTSRAYRGARMPDLATVPIVKPSEPNASWQHYMGPIIWRWMHVVSLSLLLTEMADFFKAVLALIECSMCRGHFMQMCVYFQTYNTLMFRDAYTLVGFVHDTVNYRLGKKIMGVGADMRSQYLEAAYR